MNLLKLSFIDDCAINNRLIAKSSTRYSDGCCFATNGKSIWSPVSPCNKTKNFLGGKHYKSIKLSLYILK